MRTVGLAPTTLSTPTQAAKHLQRLSLPNHLSGRLSKGITAGSLEQEAQQVRNLHGGPHSGQLLATVNTGGAHAPVAPASIAPRYQSKRPVSIDTLPDNASAAPALHGRLRPLSPTLSVVNVPRFADEASSLYAVPPSPRRPMATASSRQLPETSALGSRTLPVQPSPVAPPLPISSKERKIPASARAPRISLQAAVYFKSSIIVKPEKPQRFKCGKCSTFLHKPVESDWLTVALHNRLGHGNFTCGLPSCRGTLGGFDFKDSNIENMIRHLEMRHQLRYTSEEWREFFKWKGVTDQELDCLWHAQGVSPFQGLMTRLLSLSNEKR